MNKSGKREQKLKIKPSDLSLYLVTDRSWNQGDQFVGHVEEALKNGVSILQVREKQIDRELFIERAQELKGLAAQYQVPYIINDDVEVAIAVNADGVHIGQSDRSVLETRKMIGQDKILGVSTQTLDQAIRAEKEGADYLGVGAVFPTSTKSDAGQVSLETLKAICRTVSIPVVAIGGISRDNVMELKGSGVDGVAVISAILAQAKIDQATVELKGLSQKMATKEMSKVLTIAGSDCSGGAGIQADLKTMAAHGCYGMSVITALTAQNTRGVYGVVNCDPEFVENQIDCIFKDIRPDAVKIGMVSSAEIVHSVAQKLKVYQPEFVVVDPVMVATSGSKLLAEEAMDALKKELIPLATVITPNLYEAELLADMKISSSEDMVEAAKKIGSFYSGNILIKGGHLDDCANDCLFSNGQVTWFEGKRVANPNTHGTGCTLSSAIASNLAKGYTVTESIRNSKAYITGALEDMLDLGQGSGPLNHLYQIKK
jgi:hydroxymethylpyrimidine kinase/phosphomethylpyrimidine kinase/thiamine-phosphate diphosphorylase